ncbi:hypothetical protein AVEN_65641-1 [Araneus ventricosus]|uniref:Uncharacterized protein n=1 Tax=Araneus ventricosus TaxID=182803 RepID=A0A4Y2IZS9_ARAVE|nr:hypothetical protein AVEN_65641-1 [Araneus ventricosus]
MKSVGHATNPDSQNIRAHTSNAAKSGKAFIRKLLRNGFLKTGYPEKEGKENIRCKTGLLKEPDIKKCDGCGYEMEQKGWMGKILHLPTPSLVLGIHHPLSLFLLKHPKGFQVAFLQCRNLCRCVGPLL